ncbi:histone-like nucleoid-structuring protein Lsr2 [Nocardioides sambongensis]|uniref:histone-like nucleoid-structuring protein Lsr2 n=1 Tax=Nocardioides sambongensis TaxID=2589074 RepID=UPI001128DFC2|nr:Lsr2 family protein [Nocardioides sambongensis]
MARTTHVVISDDMDGSDDAQEVSFALQGTSYTIDLTAKNFAKLEKALAPFIENAQRVPASKRARRPSANGQSKSAKVRSWAKDNGYEVPNRGRVPQAVVEAYDAAH